MVLGCCCRHRLRGRKDVAIGWGRGSRGGGGLVVEVQIVVTLEWDGFYLFNPILPIFSESHYKHTPSSILLRLQISTVSPSILLHHKDC
ncbi:hypothetical protein L6452_11215 [Arctium lappa]|uniref:Uncharacterized protein n=1 Tax=Arctium lappa TaxID=4217 RepID=A0ACB9DNI4_ARCLA|nr:hypothetical protein L6452_11215 [Arctium lappa]